MAVEFMEGFDTFTAAQVARRYPGYSTQNMITGRYGVGQALQTQFDGQGINALITSRSEYYFGFDFLYQGYWFTDADAFCILYSSGGAGIASLSTYQPTTLVTTWGSTSSNVLPINTWMNLQAHIVISPTVGVFQVRIDGNYVINLTNINTGSTNIGQIRLIGGNWRWQTFDNFWIFNTLGTHSNTWPVGRMTVQPLYPLSDGTYQQWTPDFGAAHYSMVHDLQPDDDTTYVIDTDPGHIDSYGIQGITGFPSNVHGVRADAVCRKDNAAIGKAAQTVVKSGSTLTSSSNFTLSTSYISGGMYVTDDPNTGQQWTTSGVNALEVGVKTGI